MRVPVHPAKSKLGQSAPTFWSVLQKIRHNGLEILPDQVVHAPVLSGRIAWQNWHMVMDPQIIHHITDTHVQNYPRSDLIRRVLEPAIGQGMFLSDGMEWLWQRHAAAPALGRHHFAGLKPKIKERANALCNRLEHAKGPSINIYHESVSVTFDLICRVLFSDIKVVDRDAMEHAFESYVSKSLGRAVLQTAGMPRWMGRVFSGAAPVTHMHDIIERLIHKRQADGPRDHPDMLDHLLAARHPKTGQVMPLETIRDNLITFMIAGHDTTAVTLAWALYLCSLDASVQDKIRQEAGLEPDAQTFTRQVIWETLRLYPPAAISSRTARGDDQIGNLKIAKGDLVLLPTYALHRHRAYWDAPDEFHPERFAGEGAHKIPAYMPFGHGPHSCIGARLAMGELAILLSTVLSRFRVSLTSGHVPDPVVTLTLHSRNGIWLELIPCDKTG